MGNADPHPPSLLFGTSVVVGDLLELPPPRLRFDTSTVVGLLP